MNEDYTYKLSQIIYGSYVKMDRLTKIVYDAFSNSSLASATKLNVFIDVYSVLHTLFSEHMRTIVENPIDITAGLINMCAHYRSFFRKLGVETYFYLVFSTNTCDINRKFISGYNEIFAEKCQIPAYKKLAEDNIMLLQALCPYLPDIHFIHSPRGYESSVVIAHLIRNIINDGMPTMIISRDFYPLQLTTMFPNTTFLYPRKTKTGGDESVLIPLREKENFREIFWDVYNKDKSMNKALLMDISPLNFSLLCSINRFAPRRVFVLYKLSVARRLITMLVGSEDIKADISLLKQHPKIAGHYNVNAIETRYKVLDVNEMMVWYLNDPESKNIQLVNIRDDTKINHINAKYFERNPIDLLHL